MDTATLTYADRLRRIADHLDASPALADRVYTYMPEFGICCSDPAEFAELADALPGVVVYELRGTLYHARGDGIYLFGSADRLCERTQVGVEPVYDYVLKATT